MRITLIRCGYVGLLTGACLAEAGHLLVWTDSDPDRIATLQAGRLPIYGPHLEAILAGNCRESKLSFTIDAGEAVRAGEGFSSVWAAPIGKWRSRPVRD